MKNITTPKFLKSKKALISIIIILFVLVVVGITRQPKVDYSDIVATANMAFDSGSDTRVTSVTGGKIGASPSVMFDALPGGVVSPTLMKQISQLDIDVVRWPAGTISRRYDLDRTGYGQDGKDKAGVADNHIIAFVEMLKSMEKTPEVFVVFNISKQYGNVDDAVSIDKNMRMLQYFIDNNIPIAGVEIGNEEYLHEVNLLNVTARAKQYVAIAQKYATLIEAAHPRRDIKLGLPFRTPRDQIGFKWDVALLDALSKNKFADAMIPHVYGEIDSKCALSDDACIKKSLDNHLKARSEEIAFLDQNGLEVWVTEASAINFGFDGTKNPSLAYSELLSQYNKKYFQVMINNGADHILYHRLAGVEGQPYNLIDIKADGSSELTRQGEDFKR
jgi:hypothetical protein